MAAEQTSTGNSLADRISKPEPAPAGMNAASKSFSPGFSWADDVETNDETAAGTTTTAPAEPATTSASEKVAAETKKDDAGAKQGDGATENLNGSSLQEPEWDVNVKLSDMQEDPNNPLYSAKDFKSLELSQEILDGIHEMKFVKPSKIQEKALPLLLKDPPTNLIGQSQSGTGKTAAFVLNVLKRVDLTTPEVSTSPQALVLAPSRELARQILGVIQTMAKYMPPFNVYAAVPQDKPQKERINTPIVVGTPGTVFDLIKKRVFDTRHLKILVLDEADNMLDQQGLGEQCLRVKQRLPPTTQIVLFSATFPDTVVDYANKFAPNANQLTLKHDDLTVEGIKQVYMDCDNDEIKYDTLVKFYGLLTVGSSIIFVKTKKSADIIQQRMTAEGHKVVALTSNYEGSARDAVIDAFRSSAAKVLITTNVLARGIDVSSVSMVINYDVPELYGNNGPTGQADCQTYLHRIGRTGRFGRVGVAVTFIASRKEFGMLKQIRNYFNTDMTRLEASNWDEVEEEVGRIIKSSRAGKNFKGNAP